MKKSKLFDANVSLLGKKNGVTIARFSGNETMLSEDTLWGGEKFEIGLN